MPTKRKSPNGFPVFFLLSYLIVIVIIISSSFFYYLDIKTDDETFYKSREIESVANMNNRLRSTVKNSIADLQILASSSALNRYAESGDISDLEALKNELLSFSLYTEAYDQVRYLDNSGMERIRVNGSGGQARLAAESQLQAKSDRYYFSESIVLEDGEIFASPLDLNVENGIVEVPLKPVLRLATPVVVNDSKKGILILNYLGSELMNLLHEASYSDGPLLYVLNSDGYWLHNPDETLEWGFMFSDRMDVTVAKIDPDFWSKIKSSETTQFFAENGLYTTNQLKPFDFNDDQKWTIVSYVPNDLLYKNSAALAKFFAVINGFLILFVSVVLAVFIYRRKR